MIASMLKNTIFFLICVYNGNVVISYIDLEDGNEAKNFISYND